MFAGAVKSLFTRLWPQRPLGCAHGLLCSLEAFHTHPGQQTGRAEASTLGGVIEKFLCFFCPPCSPAHPSLPFSTNPFSSLPFQYHCWPNSTLFFCSPTFLNPSPYYLTVINLLVLQFHLMLDTKQKNR